MRESWATMPHILNRAFDSPTKQRGPPLATPSKSRPLDDIEHRAKALTELTSAGRVPRAESRWQLNGALRARANHRSPKTKRRCDSASSPGIQLHRLDAG